MSDVLKGLNEGQYKLASLIDGSALAAASAGSGKTTTLVRRIMNMLESDAMIDPHSILCLTFTDSGAVAMRQKLLGEIGSTAYQVSINTFHSFCNDVIQNNISYFGIEDLQPVSRLEEITIMEKIIDSLDYSNPLKRTRGDKYFEVSRCLSLFGMMKQENYSPEIMLQLIDRFIKELPLNENFLYKRANKKKGIQAGDPNLRLINESKEKLTLLRFAVGLYNVYNNNLTEAKLYDFNDMIQWVLKAFSDNEDILRDYQERYTYVIVDEAQDTSGSQHEIVNKLMDFWDDSNIVMLGDERQCIYEFAGSRLQNMRDFVERYNPASISLHKNYRSTQEIVDRSVNVIEKSIQLSHLDNDIEGMNQSDGMVVANKYQSFTHENQMVVEKITSLINSGVKPSDISVIYRKHADCQRIYDHLSTLEIPVNTKRRINVLDEHIIIQILSLLEYLASDFKLLESDKFFEILHYDFAEVPRKQIEKLLVMRRDSLDLTKLDKRSFKAANAFVNLLSELESSSRNGSVLMLISDILYKTGVRKILLDDRDIRKAIVLRTFFDFVKTENEKNVNMSISEFLDLVRRMRNNRIQIGMDDVSGDSDGVFFTTCHGSKGLEFEHVFMIRCNRADWEKSRGRSSTYSLPDTITYSKGDDHEESARRLFYVAMTRAKTHLYLSCSAKDDKSKDMEPSLFLIDSGVNIVDVPTTELFDQLVSDINDNSIKFSPKIEQDRIDEILENFRMSPTALNSYLRCPLSFYYERILKVPFMDTYPLMYGTLFHRTIEEAKKRMKQGVFDINEVIEWGTELIDTKLAVNITNVEKLTLHAALKSVFPGFVSGWLDKTPKFSIPEYKIRDVLIDDVPVYGELDDIEIHDTNQIVVTDYKSGSEASIKTKMKKETGDIWRQLVFYKLLIDNHPKKSWTTINSRVVGINKEPFCVPYDIGLDDLNLVKGQIKSSYTKIMNFEFDGCGDPECKWCNIVKNNSKVDV